MPLPKTGTITLSSAGTMTFNSLCPGLIPTWAKFRVGKKAGATDIVLHWSEGQTDGTTQVCDSFFADGISRQTFKSTSKVVSHYERTSGISEVLSANNVVFVTGGILINVLVPNSSYSVTVELM